MQGWLRQQNDIMFFRQAYINTENCTSKNLLIEMEESWSKWQNYSSLKDICKDSGNCTVRNVLDIIAKMLYVSGILGLHLQS